MGVQTVWMVHLRGRSAEVVEVVALEQVVHGPCIVLVSDPVGDELPEKVPGPPSGCSGQRSPDGESVFVIAGELELQLVVIERQHGKPVWTESQKLIETPYGCERTAGHPRTEPCLVGLAQECGPDATQLARVVGLRPVEAVGNEDGAATPEGSNNRSMPIVDVESEDTADANDGGVGAFSAVHNGTGAGDSSKWRDPIRVEPSHQLCSAEQMALSIRRRVRTRG